MAEHGFLVYRAVVRGDNRREEWGLKEYCSNVISWQRLRKNELLDEFDKLCQIRHAIVHSSRILAGKNAVRLNIPPSSQKVLVKTGYAQLQECASICTSCVMTMNLKLFEEMITRWAIHWRKTDDFWNSIDENHSFTGIWDVFSSEIDRTDVQLAEMAKTKCKNAVKKEFHI